VTQLTPLIQASIMKLTGDLLGSPAINFMINAAGMGGAGRWRDEGWRDVRANQGVRRGCSGLP
ncbi:hypothetical protein, partial [Micromonospora sp. KC721]|uniref:hypothetical protein n=1 Tax=Micromonospora sp. KC721 TaxID=2530380 RepID=UPI001A9CD29B